MMFFARFLSVALVLYFSCLLGGCGGGGGSSSSGSSEGGGPGTIGNLTVDLGPDLSVMTSSSVDLEAPILSEQDPGELSYTWTLMESPAGSNANESLLTPDSRTTNFTPDLPGDYLLQIEVTAADSQERVTDQLKITAQSAFDTIGGSPPPEASSGTTDPDLSARFSASVLNTRLEGQVRALVGTGDSGLVAIAATDAGARFLKID
ncbi:MAG TPA: hypothetical protein ENN94_03255, partial [Geoalkalibacter subterraneus]|nr:hypothetical protein [Geoalkalibacter subterraneus]